MSRFLLLFLRAATLLSIALSCALLLHYLAPAEGAFCGVQSGCETVRKSAVGGLGFPGLLPSVGLAGYLAIYWLTFTPPLGRWLLPSALLGAGLGGALFLYQALVLHAFCWLCVSVDVLSICIGGVAVLLRRTADPNFTEQWDPLRGWAWFALLALCVNAPNVWLKVRASEALPEPIQRLQSDSAFTIVEFVDFQCPHCRHLHPVVGTRVALLDSPYRVLRFHVPLPIHPLADGAARAAICADQFGKGEAMANLLFAGRIEPEAWSGYVATLGISEADFRTCVDSESTRATVATHMALFQSLHKPILPLTFIGGERLEGYAPASVVGEVFHRALRPAFARLSPLAFGTLLLGLCGVLFVFGRRP